MIVYMIVYVVGTATNESVGSYKTENVTQIGDGLYYDLMIS